MRWVPRRLAMAILGMGVSASPARAAVEGHYLGSLYRTEGLIDENRMLHRYDANFLNDLPGNLALDFNMHLSYESRPGTTIPGLFRDRFEANLRKSWWRVQTEFTPWQRTGLSSSSSRYRYGQLGLLLTPAGGPQFSATMGRRDGESSTGSSSNRDFRTRISHTLYGVSPYLTFQTVHALSATKSGTDNRLQSWNGGLSGARGWKHISAQASYEFRGSTFRSQYQQSENRSHWTSAGLSWLPQPKLTVNGSVSGRWTKSEDHIGPEAKWLDEKAWTTSATYLPMRGLTFEVYRDYRTAGGPSQPLVTDFAGLRADFRRDVVRRVAFQTGYSKTFDLRKHQGPVPLDQVYATVDGWLRDGLSFRGELRALAPAEESRETLLWKRTLGIQTYPTRKFRLDATWRKDDLPGFAGVGETEIEWDFSGTFRPSSRTDVTASYRRLTGIGRILGEERYGSLALSRRMGKRTTFSINGVKRETLSGYLLTSDGWVSSDLTFWLPNEVRVKTTGRWQSPGTDRSATTYGLILDKTF